MTPRRLTSSRNPALHDDDLPLNSNLKYHSCHSNRSLNTCCTAAWSIFSCIPGIEWLASPLPPSYLHVAHDTYDGLVVMLTDYMCVEALRGRNCVCVCVS